MKGRIVKISTRQIVVEGMQDLSVSSIVRSSDKAILGEVTHVCGNLSTVTCLENSDSLKLDDEVFSSNSPLCIELAPGLIEGVFDSLQRPLTAMAKRGEIGFDNTKGLTTLNHSKKWNFTATRQVGDYVFSGDILGTLLENDVFEHRIMVPYGIEGKLTKIFSGEFTSEDIVATVEGKNSKSHFITMLQRSSVLDIRQVASKMPPGENIETTLRTVDSFFPIKKGSAVLIEGDSCSGKSIMQRQIAKYADFDVLVYVSCGNQSSEAADAASELLRFTDPKTGRSALKRTVFLYAGANFTPLAREYVLYSALTISEYFRDMGYSVLLAADSLSSWANATDLSGGDAYSKMAAALKRVGAVMTLGKEARVGSVTLVGSIDTEYDAIGSTFKFERLFDTVIRLKNADGSNYPKIDLFESVTFASGQAQNKDAVLFKEVMQEADKIKSTARFSGVETLPKFCRLVLKTAELFENSFLNQDAFDRLDKPMNPSKRNSLLSALTHFYKAAKSALERGKGLDEIFSVSAISVLLNTKHNTVTEYGGICEFISRELG